jgi:hypothetical protein
LQISHETISRRILRGLFQIVVRIIQFSFEFAYRAFGASHLDPPLIHIARRAGTLF